MSIPIHEEIKGGIEERIKVLKRSIEDFNTPITQEDYDDHFRSRETGPKSVVALRGYFNELLEREEELNLICNYVYYFERNKSL